MIAWIIPGSIACSSLQFAPRLYIEHALLRRLVSRLYSLTCKEVKRKPANQSASVCRWQGYLTCQSQFNCTP